MKIIQILFIRKREKAEQRKIKPIVNKGPITRSLLPYDNFTNNLSAIYHTSHA